MFEQAVTAGPGTATYTQHTFEILIMLLGAFLLGLWLGWLLWSKYKQQFETLSLENQSLRGSLSTINTDLSLAHNKTEMLAIAQDELVAEKTDLEKSYEELHAQKDHLETNLATIQESKAELENTLAHATASTPESAAVPIEIVHSPIDLHVEDLVVGTAPQLDLAVGEAEPYVDPTLDPCGPNVRRWRDHNSANR